MTISVPPGSPDLANAGGVRRWNFGGCEIVTVNGDLTSALVGEIRSGTSPASTGPLVLDLRYARSLHVSVAPTLAQLHNHVRARGYGVTVVVDSEAARSELVASLVEHGMPVYDDIADALESALRARDADVAS